MIVLEFLAILIVIFGGGFLVVRSLSKSPLTEQERLLREYNRLTFAAARAFRRGHTHESTVYSEAAERLLDAWKERHPS